MFVREELWFLIGLALLPSICRSEWSACNVADEKRRTRTRPSSKPLQAAPSLRHFKTDSGALKTCSDSQGKVAQHAAAAGQVLLKALQNYVCKLPVLSSAMLSSAKHLQACKGSLVEVLAFHAQSRFCV